MITLADIPLKQQRSVISIAEGELKPKLLEMGMYIGKSVEVLFKAPFGDPIAINMDGYVLALRLEEAQLIEVTE